MRSSEAFVARPANLPGTTITAARLSWQRASGCGFVERSFLNPRPRVEVVSDRRTLR